MPFYDYECSNNHRFELKQSFSSEPVALCPSCTAPAKRLINLVPVHFKGSGFYVNDYARKVPPTPGEDSNGAGSHDEHGRDQSRSADRGRIDGAPSANPGSPKPDASKGDTSKAEPPKNKGDAPATSSKS